MRELQARRGYQEVSTPIVVSERLWRQSGHWDLYREQHVPDRVRGPDVLPQADELPGVDVHLPLEAALVPRPAAALQRVRPAPPERALRARSSGLTRVRQFIQDDAHIYVRPDQLMDEILALLGEVHEAYGWFGLKPRFTLRDEAGQGDRRPGALGAGRAADDGGLRRRRHQLRAEAQGRHVLRAEDRHLHRRRPRARVADGDDPDRPDDAARAVRPDVRRRERRAAVRPIAIHRAIYGSLERFIGILIEHFAGAFPLWIAPVQAVVIPIADRHIEPAEELAAVLRARGPARRGRRLRRPDAEQDPARPGAEGARTCSSSATARSRRGRPPSPTRRGAARRGGPSWDALADRLAAEAAARGAYCEAPGLDTYGARRLGPRREAPARGARARRLAERRARRPSCFLTHKRRSRRRRRAPRRRSPGTFVSVRHQRMRPEAASRDIDVTSCRCARSAESDPSGAVISSANGRECVRGRHEPSPGRCRRPLLHARRRSPARRRRAPAA